MTRGVRIGALIALSALALAPTFLPQCATEDSESCYWDASEQGNGQGHDVIAW